MYVDIMIFKETFPPFLHFAVLFSSKMKKYALPLRYQTDWVGYLNEV